MKKNKKINPEIEYSYDDEIDLFELFQKIWKWKWLTATIIIIFCSIAFLYFKLKPATYTIESTIRIGKIAGVLIEPESDVQDYLKSNIFKEKNICLSILDIQIKNTANKDFIKISSKANSADIAFSCFENAINKVLNRHSIIYKKAIKKLNDNINSSKTNAIIKPQYILEAYTYPSSLVSKPEKPVKQDDKRITTKVIVVFVLSLFLGIFLSFFIDYILSHRNKN